MLTARRRRTRPPFAPGLAALILLGPLAILVAGCDALSEGGGPGDAPTVVPDTEEVYRIGSVDGGSWDTFSRIVAAGFDEEANLYVLDAGSRTLTVVDPQGRLLRTVGRAGDGPGELRNPLALAVLPGGQVMVSDAGHRGLLLFDADGSYLRSLPFGDGVSAPSILLPHGEDAVVYVAREMMMGGPGMGGGGLGGRSTGPFEVPIRRVSSSGESSVLHHAWLPPREPPQVSEGGGGVRVMRPVRAFEPQLHVAVLPDGAVAVADTTTYRLRIVGPGQGVESTLERPVQPTPTTDREREREKARRLAELESGGGPQGPGAAMMGGGGAGGAPSPSQVRSIMRDQIENNLVFWPEISVIQRLAVDREGRIWVERFGGIGEPGPIEILDADGTLNAVVPPNTVPLPAAFGPGGLAAWIERDDLDVPFVRVARLAGLP